jgi:hypothetical protein
MGKNHNRRRPMTERRVNIEECLNVHPELRGRIERLLDVVNDPRAELDRADDAEESVILELRHLGQEVMSCWAKEKVSRKVAAFEREGGRLKKHGIKEVHWYTTFGEISASEQCYLQGGKMIRPFSSDAQVRSRSYSAPLQRRITDFGADNSFGEVPEKLKEHYGISAPVSSARVITLNHAKKIRTTEILETEIPEQDGKEFVIAEVDGSMIPIVTNTSKESDEGAVDRRKAKELKFKEGRLTIAYAQGTVSPLFGATMGSTQEAGDHLANCAIRAGVGQQTKVHCVGDGAPWIVEQVNRVFGLQGEYLIDFYHFSDYLCSAADSCASPALRKVWLDEQKERAKAGQINEILEALRPHMEPDTVPNLNAPVRAAYRYILNRPNQFDYPTAIKAKLPIGSGEVESAHRYIIQERLKIAGAWWKEDNADYMLALRTLRANSDWEQYWQFHTDPLN